MRGWVRLQWIFLKTVCPFHDGRFTSAPTLLCWVFSRFDPKWHDLCVLPSLFICSYPKQPFSVSPDEKVLKGKHFAKAEEVRQKMAEALKDIKINELKNCYEQWEKVLIVYGIWYCIKCRVIWRWLKFKHVRISTQFLINSRVWGVSTSYLVSSGLCGSNVRVREKTRVDQTVLFSVMKERAFIFGWVYDTVGGNALRASRAPWSWLRPPPAKQTYTSRSRVSCEVPVLTGIISRQRGGRFPVFWLIRIVSKFRGKR